MRVLWVNEAADFIGGCEQYIFNTVRLLREHDVHSSLLYDCRQNLSVDFVKPFDHAFPMVDIKTQVAEVKPDLIYVHRLSGRKIVEELRQTRVPTVRFFHDYQLLCLREHKYRPIGLRTCNATIGMRCYPCLGFIRKSGKWPGIRFTRVGHFRSEIKANQELSAIVTGSQHMVNHLIAHGFDARKTHRLYYYSLPPTQHESIPQEDSLLLFAGQLHTGKGLDILLKAMTIATPQARLLVAGTGPQAEQLKRFSASLGLSERVTFEGWLPSSELWRFYMRATCVVVPSRFPEPFCMTGTEAMSYGRPVIGTAVGAIPEWMEDGVTGILVPPNDPGAMARAIDRMLGNQKQAIEMGIAGKNRYTGQFGPERHIAALLEIFRTVAMGENKHV